MSFLRLLAYYLSPLLSSSWLKPSSSTLNLRSETTSKIKYFDWTQSETDLGFGVLVNVSRNLKAKRLLA